jgi:hypothetical protein
MCVDLLLIAELFFFVALLLIFLGLFGLLLGLVLLTFVSHSFLLAFPGFLPLVNFSSSMVWGVFVKGSIYLSSRLTPTSLYSASSIFSCLAARLRILLAYRRIFFRIQAESLEIFLRLEIMSRPQMHLQSAQLFATNLKREQISPLV